jgi:hypothetical protein
MTIACISLTPAGVTAARFRKFVCQVAMVFGGFQDSHDYTPRRERSLNDATFTHV